MTKRECESEYHKQYEYLSDEIFKLEKRFHKKFVGDSLVFFLGCLNSCVVKTITCSAPNEEMRDQLLEDTTEEGIEWGKNILEQMRKSLKE